MPRPRSSAARAPPPEPTPEPRPNVSAEPEAPEPADLIQEDLKVGTGAEAKDGDKVKVNYTGRLLKTNFMFDTSIGPGKKPFEFTDRQGGRHQGLGPGRGGHEGGRQAQADHPLAPRLRRRGQPPKIPGKATLVFEIELLGVNETADAGADSGAGAAAHEGAKKKRKGGTSP